jgi:hypothetical protein
MIILPKITFKDIEDYRAFWKILEIAQQQWRDATNSAMNTNDPVGIGVAVRRLRVIDELLSILRYHIPHDTGLIKSYIQSAVEYRTSQIGDAEPPESYDVSHLWNNENFIKDIQWDDKRDILNVLYTPEARSHFSAQDQKMLQEILDEFSAKQAKTKPAKKSLRKPTKKAAKKKGKKK